MTNKEDKTKDDEETMVQPNPRLRDVEFKENKSQNLKKKID